MMRIAKRTLLMAGVFAASGLIMQPVAIAADDSEGGGKHSGHGGGADGGKGGGGHGGHGEQSGQGMMSHGSVPGDVKEMCQDHEGMPPHYCEPTYKVASSVKGVRIDSVDIAGDQELMVTLDEMNSMAPGVKQSIVVIGGGGDLAGAVIVKSGWKDSSKVHLKLTGDGTVYDHNKFHLHLFPLTSQ